MRSASFDHGLYVRQSVFLNAGFIFHGRWYYVVVVPVSQAAHKWKNPDEMDVDEVSASRLAGWLMCRVRGCKWHFLFQLGGKSLVEAN